MSSIDRAAAFPTPDNSYEGMTLRDYFSAKVMHALIGRMVVSDFNKPSPLSDLANTSYGIADAMLKERAK